MNDRRTHPPDGSEPRGGSGEHPGDARESERLLRALRGAVPVETAEKVAARRRVLVAAIGREIEAVPARIARQERRRRWLRSASVAAATLVLTLTGTTLWRAGWGEPAEVAQLETSDTPSEGQALVTLITPHGTRQDVLSTGQELTVARGEKVDAQLPGATRFHFEPLVNHEPQVNHEPLVDHEAQGSREAQVQALNGKQQGATPLHSAQGSLGEQAVLQLSQLRKQNQSLFVKSGVLSVDVPENKAMRRLVTVVTPHARVEVKGTQFQVQVSEGAGAHTSVSVSRGSVSVSWLGGHTLLTRGQTWDSQNMTHVPKLSFAEPSGAPHGITGPAQTERAPQPSVAAATRAVTPRPAVVPDARQKTSTESATADAAGESTLALQNTLLERAMDAEKSGNWHRASELYDRLIVEFPDSPLRATALSERRRVLERLNRL